MSSEVSIELDVLFDRFFIFELYRTLQLVWSKFLKSGYRFEDDGNKVRIIDSKDRKKFFSQRVINLFSVLGCVYEAICIKQSRYLLEQEDK